MDMDRVKMQQTIKPCCEETEWMRERIRELEAELAKVNENRAKMFKEMCEDDETIIKLEADLVLARTTEANLHDHIRKLQEDFGKANAKWLKAEMALRKIAEHPHGREGKFDHFDNGHRKGHSCCAEIARKALEP